MPKVVLGKEDLKRRRRTSSNPFHWPKFREVPKPTGKSPRSRAYYHILKNCLACLNHHHPKRLLAGEELTIRDGLFNLMKTHVDTLGEIAAWDVQRESQNTIANYMALQMGALANSGLQQRAIYHTLVAWHAIFSVEWQAGFGARIKTAAND
jgi:hypothetical protein